LATYIICKKNINVVALNEKTMMFEATLKKSQILHSIVCPLYHCLSYDRLQFNKGKLFLFST